MTGTERIFGLDFLRAAAISLILFSQCLWILPQNNGIITQITALFNCLGLETFFVLSGFLLGQMLLPHYIRKDFGWETVLKFFKQRALRVLPVYWLILLMNIVIAVFIGNPIENSWKYFLLLQNLATPISSFFQESWGIPIIIFSALLLTIILWALHRIMPMKNKSALFINTTVLLILIALLMKFIYYLNHPNLDIPQWDASIKSVTIYRLDAVFIGVLFSWFRFAFYSAWVKYRFVFAMLGFLGLGFIMIGVGYFQILIAYNPLFWIVFYLPITSLSIALLLPLFSEWIFTVSFIKRPITFISSISYSVYMVHFGVVYQLMIHYYPASSLTMQNLFWFVLFYVSMTIFLGAALYQFYERPLLKKGNS